MRVEIFMTETYTEMEVDEDKPAEVALTLFNGLLIALSQMPDIKSQLKVLRVGTRLVRKKLKENYGRNQP